MVVPQIVVIAEPGQGGAIVVDIATDAHAIGSEFASRNIFYSAISFGAAGVSFADVIGEIAWMRGQCADTTARTEMVSPEQITI
ncbi:MAG: hypothetical protein AB7G88_15025, partial [Thermomicrobiales bacterium]